MKKLFLISMLALVVFAGCKMPAEKKEEAKVLGLEEAKAHALEFINENLVNPGSEVTINSISEENELYKMEVQPPQGNAIESYMTRDGRLFFAQGFDIAEMTAENEAKKAAASNQAQQVAAQVEKSDKPKVELFVMAFCPYGKIAEEAMGPVYDLLGDKADINVRYIASLNGDDINNIQSLHGTVEGLEDVRQLCVEKYYGKDAEWKYINGINENCFGIYRQGEAYEKCWKKEAQNAGADVNKIGNCVNNEGPEMIKAEDAAAKGYGVSGSPTLMINGAKVNAARNPEGYKQAICNAFNEKPEECNTALSADGGTASGGCN